MREGEEVKGEGERSREEWGQDGQKLSGSLEWLSGKVKGRGAVKVATEGDNPSLRGGGEETLPQKKHQVGEGTWIQTRRMCLSQKRRRDPSE